MVVRRGTATEGIDKKSFKSIFEDQWNQFKQVHPRYDSTEYDQTVQKMLDCGNPEKMGFVQYFCPSCGETRCIAFTCKSCFCLSCAKVYTDRWADYIGRRLIPGVTYRHVVLTMPDFLHTWFYRNRNLLSPFMQAGNLCLKDVLQTYAGFEFIGRMVQHILPKGFQRIRYYGLHCNVRYKKARQYLAEILPSNIPDEPRGYYVLAPKPFAQRFIESFVKDPLLCPKCGYDMLLELIYHPEYGIIKEYELFEEIIEEQQYDGPDNGRVHGLQQCSQRMVQLSLPFL